ncbi:MAG: hypothetical protein K8U03_25665 [Planctomycetia bacterium]|nr:hypothetical protein [Planctomycetia bacterium]
MAPSTAAGQLRLVGPDSPAAVNPAAGAPAANAPVGAGLDAVDGGGDRRPPSGAGSDPTMPGPDMRRLIGDGDANRNASAGPPPLPEIRILARVFARNKPPVAIIEVGGKPLTIRMGSEIQIPGARGAMQLKVTELSISELHIEIVDRKQTIYLN